MGGQMSVLFDGKIKSAFNLVDAKLKALWYSFLFFCRSKPRDTRPFSRKINHANISAHKNSPGRKVAGAKCCKIGS